MTYSEQMLDALDNGDLKKAKNFFQQAIKNDDDDTLYILAEELYALGFNPQASQIYRQLLKKYPDEDEIRTVLADMAVSAGDNDKALTYLAAIKPESDAYVSSLLTAADVYQTMGMTEVSESKLKEAQKLAPAEPAIWFGLGELYFSLDRYGEAATQYQKLLDQNQTKVAGVNVKQRLAASLAGMGEYEQALRLYQELPTEVLDKDARFQMGFLYLQTKDYQKAVDTLQQLEQADPDYTSLYPYLAEAQEKNGDLQGAFLTSQSGIGHDEYNEVLYQKAYDLSTKLGDEASAEKYLQQLLKIDPDNQGSILALSNLYIKQHRYQENLDLLKKYGQGTQDPQVLWNAARSYDALEQYDKAKENYLLAYNSLKSDPAFLRDLITFFQEEGMAKEEILALQNYVKLEPNDFERQERLDELLDEQQ